MLSQPIHWLVRFGSLQTFGKSKPDIGTELRHVRLGPCADIKSITEATPRRAAKSP